MQHFPALFQMMEFFPEMYYFSGFSIYAGYAYTPGGIVECHFLLSIKALSAYFLTYTLPLHFNFFIVFSNPLFSTYILHFFDKPQNALDLCALSSSNFGVFFIFKIIFYCPNFFTFFPNVISFNKLHP